MLRRLAGQRRSTRGACATSHASSRRTGGPLRTTRKGSWARAVRRTGGGDDAPGEKLLALNVVSVRWWSHCRGAYLARACKECHRLRAGECPIAGAGAGKGALGNLDENHNSDVPTAAGVTVRSESVKGTYDNLREVLPP